MPDSKITHPYPCIPPQAGESVDGKDVCAPVIVVPVRSDIVPWDKYHPSSPDVVSYRDILQEGDDELLNDEEQLEE